MSCLASGQDREAAGAFFNSVVGQRAIKEAHGESVAAPTQSMEDVKITEQQVPVVVSVAPPSEPHASDASKAEEEAKAESPKKTAEAEPMDEKEASEPKQATPPADVEMEDASEEIAVSYTPFKPISQMTVTILREELKKLGLSIKGLKAELVKRLKEAAGEA